jgi:hypothetical protein
MRRLRQWLCGLKGHMSLKHCEGGRVMMRCTNCEHDSPGWESVARPPRLRYDGDRKRHDMTPDHRRRLLLTESLHDAQTSSTR